MGVTLYGIANCDSVKRARAWLDARSVACHFHDFKKAGLPQRDLLVWATSVGWELLLNRQGTTWRKLDDAAKAEAQDRAGALRLMLAQPSVIKRPVVVWADGQVTVGFDAAQWAARKT